MGKAPLYQGKTKNEIAQEAFAKFGPEATRGQVDRHFKRYKLPHCEVSMYWTHKGRAKRELAEKQRNEWDSVKHNYANRIVQQEVQAAFKTIFKTTPADLVSRAKTLAQDCGGINELKALLDAL